MQEKGGIGQKRRGEKGNNEAKVDLLNGKDGLF